MQSIPSVVIELGGLNFTVKYPNVGQLIDIEVKKQTMTRGHYNTMARNASTQDHLLALNYIDAYATFSVLNPEIVKAADIEYFDLNQTHGIEFIDQYLSVYVPFKKKCDEFVSEKWDALTKKIKDMNEASKKNEESK